ncbi:hypothetical protein GCM10010191_54460 [Actinomadura vinacea]|uniref:Uncharacterized protein n=1 Tax=Actinomadura vinacea TaxID=115336 RepID=A0ABN3JLB8_9ACTN
MNAGEREELARLLPPRDEPRLPRDRQRHIKEFVMTEIRQEVKPKRRRLRPAVLAPVLAAAVAVAVAGPQVLGGDEAYAVSKQKDGTILITLGDMKNPKRLQGDLREMGLNAVVDFVPDGKQCAGPRVQNVLPASSKLSVLPEGDSDRGVFAIDPRVVKSGQTVVLEFALTEGIGPAWTAGMSPEITDGPVKPCKLVDGPGS